MLLVLAVLTRVISIEIDPVLIAAES